MGHIGDKLGFQPIRGFERFVSFAQELFDALRVRHVDIGQQHDTVRQRDGGKINDRPIGTLEPARLPFAVGQQVDVIGFDGFPGKQDTAKRVRRK
jgi:hypothetical protein